MVRLGSLQKSELIFRLVGAALATAAAAATEAPAMPVDGFLRNVDRFTLRVERHADAGVRGIESLSVFDIFRLIRVVAVAVVVVEFPVFGFEPCNNDDSFFLPLRALLMAEQQSRLVWPNEV